MSIFGYEKAREREYENNLFSIKLPLPSIEWLRDQNNQHYQNIPDLQGGQTYPRTPRTCPSVTVRCEPTSDTCPRREVRVYRCVSHNSRRTSKILSCVIKNFGLFNTTKLHLLLYILL